MILVDIDALTSITDSNLPHLIDDCYRIGKYFLLNAYSALQAWK